MVQKKAENKVGIRAEMKNSIKLDRRTAGRSPLYQELIARPSQSIRGGGELKKKLRRSRSWKLADRRSIGSPPNQDEDTKKKQMTIKMEDRSPNYMKPTSSSDKRKENVQVSTQTQTSNRIQSARDLNYTRKRPDARGPKSTTASASKNMKQLTRSSSLKPIKPSMKATGLPLFSLQDITRSTCSSTIKDSTFPDYLDLHPGGTESEGTSIFKVCPYTYCSLNGHFHKPLPPLKHFISARRRLLKTQKSLKMKGGIPRRVKNAKEVKKKIDTGQNLVPVRSEQVFRTDMISSPRWPPSWNEEQSELLTGDWSDEFFLDMFPDSAPDITEVGSSGGCGNIESCSDDAVAQATDEKDDAKELSESIVVSWELEQDFVQVEETVPNGAHFEKNVPLEADNGDNHQDGNDDSCPGDAETAASLSAASQCIDSNETLNQLSAENGCSFPEEQDVISEAFGGSESDEDGFSTETITEMEEDDEARLCDEAPGNSFPGGAPEPASSALMHEAVSIYDSRPLGFCIHASNPLSEDSSEPIENVKTDGPAAEGDEIVIMEEDQTELTGFVELHPTDLEPELIASEVLEFNLPAAQTDEIDTTKEEVDTRFTYFCPNVDILAAERNEINVPKEDVQHEAMEPINLHPAEIEPMIYESIGVDVPVSQGDETNSTNEQVQPEATAPVVQTEACVIIDLYPATQKAMDYEDAIPNPDDQLVKGDEAFVDVEGSLELKDGRDAKEFFVDVQVASDGQACPDAQTIVEAIPDYSEEDLVADETTFSVSQSSDLAVVDITEESQMQVIEYPVGLEAQNYPLLLLVPEAKDETATGDNNPSLIQKDNEFVQVDIAKDQNHQDAAVGEDFQVESREEVPDEEGCTTNVAEIQSQSFVEKHDETGPSDSQCVCDTSSGESGDQNKPTSVQDCCKDVEMQMNCATEQQEESGRNPAKAENHFIMEKSSTKGVAGSPGNQSEVSNFESKDDIGSMNADEKVMRPVTDAIQPTVSNYNGLKYRASPKFKVENTDEERIFNPRGPRFLPIEPDPDAEKVDLRHQMMDERKNSEEWMLDYALRKAVNKLAPARKRKVALLVEAFETVMPLPKCETRIHHSAMSFTHARTIQACS